MKKLLLWSLLFLTYIGAAAQNSANLDFYNLEPDVIIQGETLKNFPGTDLNEMLLGRIPGLNAVYFDQVENPVLYMVDGLVWASIEGLSVHNVESVAYYRGGLNHQLGIQQSKPNGVIYIKTKQPNNKQPLRANLDAVTALNVFNHQGTEGKHSLMQGYNLALSQGSERLSWRGSVGYNRAGRNRYRQDYSSQYQFDGGLVYEPARWIELAVKVNYAPLDGQSVIGLNSPVFTGQNADYLHEREDWNGAISARLDLGGGWTNHTSVMKNHNLQEATTRRVSGMATVEDYRETKDRSFAASNNLNYQFDLNSNAIRMNAAALLQLNKMDYSRQIASNFQFGEEGMSSSRGTYFSYRQKFYSAALQTHAEFYEVVNLQVGLRADDSTLGQSEKTAWSPFVYSDINVHQLLFKHMGWLKGLSIYGAYGEDGRNTPHNTWTDDGYNTLPSNYPPGNNIVPGSTLNPLESGYHKRMKTLNVGFKSVFLDKRIHLMADWFRSTYLDQFSVPLPTSSDISEFAITAPFQLSGWRVAIDFEITQQESFSWVAGINVFQNKNELINKSQSLVSYLLDSDNNFSNLNMEEPQFGMQHFVQYKQLSLALNGYAYFNHLYKQTTMQQSGKLISIDNSSLLALNYIALGYDFGSKDAAHHTVNNSNYRVSIVGRNLLTSKKGMFVDNLSKSIGISFKVNF